MIPIDTPLADAAQRAAFNLDALAATVSSVTGTKITADDLQRLGDNLYLAATPADYGDRAIELLSPDRSDDDDDDGSSAGHGYFKRPAPRLDTYQLIPRDGNPNALLERLPLKEALEKVTREHKKIADWIRAQRGRPGWDLDRPTAEMWPYIHASKRLKACRIQLEEMWDDIEREHDEPEDDWAQAQAEADALSARSMAEKVRSGWPGEGMHA